MWYNDGMTTDNWLAISAGATFLLALAAFWAIWQNYSLRKKERKERLLNEIIEWAIDVARCGLEKELPDLASITNMNEGKLHLAMSTNMLALSFQSMRGRNQYIHAIASAFGQDLLKAVDTLTKDLEEHIKLLDTLRYIATVKFTSVTNENMAEYMLEVNESSIQIASHKLKLDELTVKIIEEATKIKTQDIGK
jgi:hypothetical protein